MSREVFLLRCMLVNGPGVGGRWNLEIISQHRSPSEGEPLYNVALLVLRQSNKATTIIRSGALELGSRMIGSDFAKPREVFADCNHQNKSWEFRGIWSRCKTCAAVPLGVYRNMDVAKVRAWPCPHRLNKENGSFLLASGRSFKSVFNVLLRSFYKLRHNQSSSLTAAPDPRSSTRADIEQTRVTKRGQQQLSQLNLVEHDNADAPRCSFPSFLAFPAISRHPILVGETLVLHSYRDPNPGRGFWGPESEVTNYYRFESSRSRKAIAGGASLHDERQPDDKVGQIFKQTDVGGTD